MSRRGTFILGMVVIAAGVAAGVSFAHMQKERSAAEQQKGDLREVVRLLGQMRETARAPGRVAAMRLDGADLNRRIREAAGGAGIAQRLASVEPNRPARVGESDYNELMVFVRFERANLRELGSFMHRLCAGDPSCRIKTIELEAPGEGVEGQQWTSDITLAYLTFAPREGKGEGQ